LSSIRSCCFLACSPLGSSAHFDGRAKSIVSTRCFDVKMWLQFRTRTTSSVLAAAMQFEGATACVWAIVRTTAQRIVEHAGLDATFFAQIKRVEQLSDFFSIFVGLLQSCMNGLQYSIQS
jgi:hypothetical protein